MKTLMLTCAYVCALGLIGPNDCLAQTEVGKENTIDKNRYISITCTGRFQGTDSHLVLESVQDTRGKVKYELDERDLSRTRLTILLEKDFQCVWNYLTDSLPQLPATHPGISVGINAPSETIVGIGLSTSTKRNIVFFDYTAASETKRFISAMQSWVATSKDLTSECKASLSSQLELFAYKISFYK